MRLGDYAKAVDAFEKAKLLNPQDTKARDHLLLALYAVGQRQSAYKRAGQIIAKDPTDLVPKALMALEGQKQMSRFVRQVRDFVGEAEFEMLQTSLVFAELGLFDEATRLLRATCVEAVPQEKQGPLPLYYLAYFISLQQADETPARAYLKQAAATYKDYVFPSCPEELEVLQYAVHENPGDAYAHLHLGNLYGHLGRLNEAAQHWQKAGDLNPSLSIALSQSRPLCLGGGRRPGKS